MKTSLSVIEEQELYSIGVGAVSWCCLLRLSLDLFTPYAFQSLDVSHPLRFPFPLIFPLP